MSPGATSSGTADSASAVAAQYPQIKLIREHLPLFREPAIARGFHAWRKARKLHLHYPRWANPLIGGPAALAAMVSPEIAVKPLEIGCDERLLSPWEATGLEIAIDGRRDADESPSRHSTSSMR